MGEQRGHGGRTRPPGGQSLAGLGRPHLEGGDAVDRGDERHVDGMVEGDHVTDLQVEDLSGGEPRLVELDDPPRRVRRAGAPTGAGARLGIGSTRLGVVGGLGDRVEDRLQRRVGEAQRGDVLLRPSLISSITTTVMSDGATIWANWGFDSCWITLG
jgi:hypothetical protein